MKREATVVDEGVRDHNSMVCGYCCHHCAEKDCTGWMQSCEDDHAAGTAACRCGDKEEVGICRQDRTS